jgi:hypothetical protein
LAVDEDGMGGFSSVATDNRIWNALNPDEPRDAAPGGAVRDTEPDTQQSTMGPLQNHAASTAPTATQAGVGSALPKQFLPADSDPVCVPATPARLPEEEPFVLETHEIAGDQCLLVFTSPQLLVSRLGRYQPFLVMYMDAAAQAAAQGDVQRVHVDPILPENFPRWTESSYLQLLADVQTFTQTKREDT